MRSLLPFGVALATLSAGCAMSIPETAPYPVGHVHTADPRTPDAGSGSGAAEAAPGYSFCSRTEVAARSLASAQSAGFWTLGALGLAATGGGAFTTLVNTDQRRLIAGTGVTLAGVALGIAAYNLWLRSEASSRLSQAANLAMLEKHDRQAFESCVRAKAAWAAAKSDPDGITRELLAEQERENRRLHEEIERLEHQGHTHRPPFSMGAPLGAAPSSAPKPPAGPPIEPPPVLAPRP